MRADTGRFDNGTIQGMVDIDNFVTQVREPGVNVMIQGAVQPVTENVVGSDDPQQSGGTYGIRGGSSAGPPGTPGITC